MSSCKTRKREIGVGDESGGESGGAARAAKNSEGARGRGGGGRRVKRAKGSTSDGNPRWPRNKVELIQDRNNMASSHSSDIRSDNATQFKSCHFKEGDTSFRITRLASEIPNCEVLKSGPLFISSKGLGWISWKKRWFVLTRISLVFFRTDPGGLYQKGSETNPILGGLELNNSGSVAKSDKKILTVSFPDGREDRIFTLKTETSEELQEWKGAIENALAQAPSAAMGQNGTFRNDISDSMEADLSRDTQPMGSSVIGRPVHLALQDADGSPSFLEKALEFIEKHGLKVEGVLRQSADVEEVKRRFREYDQGKTEFSAEEDAHVIGDCIKYVLREMPSSPVPATCCTALVEAYISVTKGTDRRKRVDSLRTVIYDTFPEPNRLLMQRIVKMMLTVATNKSQNRMSLSALAACMAPLLLRPLLLGDCEFEDDFSMGGDSSIQLMKAAAAANHAQAIVIILLEEYDRIFEKDLLDEDSMSESGEGDTEDDYSTENPEDDEQKDDDGSDGGGSTDNESNNDHSGSEEDTDDDTEHSSSQIISQNKNNIGNQPHHDDDEKKKGATLQDSNVQAASKKPTDTSNPIMQKVCTRKASLSSDIPVRQESKPKSHSFQKHGTSPNKTGVMNLSSDIRNSTNQILKSATQILPIATRKSVTKTNEQVNAIKNTILGRPYGKKDPQKESADLSRKDKVAIQKPEDNKNDLQNETAKKVKDATAQENVETGKEGVRDRRIALLKEIERLREKLQKQRDLRTSLESGLMNMRPGNLTFASAVTDEKTRADLEEVAQAEADIVNLKQKVADLRGQLNCAASLCESCRKSVDRRNNTAETTSLEVKELSSSKTETHSSKNRDLPMTSGSKSSSSPDPKFSKNSSTRAPALPSPTSKPSLSHRHPSHTGRDSSAPNFHTGEPTGTTSKNPSSRDEGDSHGVEGRARGELTQQPTQKPRKSGSGSRTSQEHNELSMGEEPPANLSQGASFKFNLFGIDNAKKDAHRRAQDASARSKHQHSSTLKFLAPSSHAEDSGARKPSLFCTSKQQPEQEGPLDKLTSRLNFLKERRNEEPKR